MAIHVVTSNAVKVAVGPDGGNKVVHIIRKGGVLPAGTSEDVVGRLVERGLVEQVSEPAPEDPEEPEEPEEPETPEEPGEPEDPEEPEAQTVSIPDGQPSDEWSVKELKAYADEYGVNLSGARTKGEFLEAIEAANSSSV